ncbi:hypothetical protein [Brevibacillus sp. H7]|jgi:gas vesicle protein|uniref:hypothetical protein n=1 Tax=Brevibacillus sp. H7 TaxID=3349138 RepID=UPI00382279B4
MTFLSQAWKQRVIWGLLIGLLVCAVSLVQPAQAASSKELQRKVSASLQKVVKYYYKSDNDYIFTKDFDWELIGLAHAGEKVDSRKWQDANERTAIDFWADQSKQLNEAGQFAKLSIALMKSGYDPTSFNGKDLLREIVKRQDSNGRMGDDQWTIFNHVLSMVALEMYGYEYDRDGAVKFLLNRYNSPDFFTDDWAFTLHALSFVDDVDGVEEAKEAILEKLASDQKENGAISDNPDTTLESLAALTSAGVDVLDAPWNKSVSYVLDNQLDDGSFKSAWSNGETSAMTTEKGLYALAVVKKGNALFERLTTKEKAALQTYRSTGDVSDKVKVYDGLPNLQKGKEVQPAGNSYTLSGKQLIVRADVKDLSGDQPLAILVKVMKGKSVVGMAVVESNSADAQYLTAGLPLSSRGNYLVEINYWYNGLSEKPEVAQDSVSFAVSVK